MCLAGKVAFITGGISAIALAMAKAFLREGARVAIAARDRGRLGESVAMLGGVLVACEADVVEDEAMEAAFARVAGMPGGIDGGTTGAMAGSPRFMRGEPG